VRPLTLDDAADLAERRSDPTSAQYQAWNHPYPVERAVALIEELIELGTPALDAWFAWAIERREDHRIVGDVALHLDEQGRNAQIGFTLHRWARGNGYATEASARVMEYGFSEWRVHRFEATLDPRNEASQRLLERLGFRHEGTAIESYWLGDVVSDDARYGLLRREWEALRGTD
jgi:aminoglycoside 6'-N-acetyltransferase